MTAPAASSLQPSSSSTAARWRLPPAAAFPLLAVLLFAFFAAGSAPSPLFVVFQQQWGFSPALLTVAFAIYAIALLASLLVAGSLSDHIGRRPVVFAALLLQAGAMLTFLLAEGINGIIAATPTSIAVELISSSGSRQVTTFRTAGGANTDRFFQRVDGVPARRLRLTISADDVRVWLRDVRIQGQSTALARYIRKSLKFTPPSQTSSR